MSLFNTKQKIRDHETLYTTNETGRGKWKKKWTQLLYMQAKEVRFT